MTRRAGGFGYGRGERPGAPPGMGGLFSTVLNVAGSFVGDPALGSQVASFAQPGFANITQTPQEIADMVAPTVATRLASPGVLPNPAALSPQAQQIGAGVAAYVARDLATQGVALAPGTVGAELQHPSILDAFGGPNAKWVLTGGLALAALLVLKEI